MVKICDSCQAGTGNRHVSYHKLFDVLKQFQNEVNDIRSERLARIRVGVKDCDTIALTGKGFGHYARECRKPKRVKDNAYHKEKMMMMCKQAEQGVPLQAEQADWLEDMDEEIDEPENSTFANPKYCKQAQSNKPCLYQIPYDTSDPANRFAPDGEEIVTLSEESRSKLDKDKTKQVLDIHCFIHELKKEINDDLEYVNSLEKELDELESEKADFSNIYYLLLEECVLKKMLHVSYLHSSVWINANTEMQMAYIFIKSKNVNVLHKAFETN
ncbi:hypothetical protein Tco_0314055 [Tanacetum coccineum]